TNGTVVFPPGVTNRTICIRVVGETIYEAHETFRLVLTNAANGVIPNALITGLIINDDLAPALTISDVFVLEGNSGVTQAIFTVTVPSPTELGIGLAFTTVDGNATSGFDYIATNGNLSFDPTVTNLTIAVSILGDSF